MSGWCAMTVEPPEDLEGQQSEFVVQTCPHCGEAIETDTASAEDRIERYLEDKYGDDTDGYAERTVQLGDLRGLKDRDAVSRAQTVFDECEVAGRVAIVVAGDTSDSGGYWYLERGHNDDAVLVDQWHGYEGARGRDATGRLQEEYGMRGYASWEA